MEIQVSLPDETSAQRLAQQLASASDTISVSVDPSRRDLRVQTKTESSRAVVTVIDTVYAWLAEHGAAAARMSVGERSYTMAGPGRMDV